MHYLVVAVIILAFVLASFLLFPILGTRGAQRMKGLRAFFALTGLLFIAAGAYITFASQQLLFFAILPILLFGINSLIVATVYDTIYELYRKLEGSKDES